MTYEREFMGFLGLSIVWVNTLLICAAALSERAELVRLRKRLSPARPGKYGLLRGKVQSQELESSGPGALYRLFQTGRSRGDGKIYFHDRRSESVINRFTVESSGRTVHVRATEGHESWVWPSRDAVAGELRCSSLAHFDEVSKEAKASQGVERTIKVAISGGQDVFVAGVMSPDQTAMTSEPGGALLVATENPQDWLGARSARILIFVALALLVGASLTLLAVWPPAFGGFSKLGALGLLLYFLLIQPAAVALSERARLPHQAKIDGMWSRRGFETSNVPLEIPSDAAGAR